MAIGSGHEVNKRRNIIVTGGSSGIGEAVCRYFLVKEPTAHIFMIDLQPPLASDLRSSDRIGFYRCDMANIEVLDLVMTEITATIDHIDVIIGNAGTHLSATIEQTSRADYTRIINTHLTGTFFLLQHSLPFMKTYGGHIVLVGSDQALVGKPHSAVYGMTKAALAQLAKSTAIDYATYGILVNCVCPGTVDTPLYRRAIHAYHEKTKKALSDIEQEEAQKQLVGRIGNVTEIANFIGFICSDMGGYITGAVLPIDGGYTAR